MERTNWRGTKTFAAGMLEKQLPGVPGKPDRLEFGNSGFNANDPIPMPPGNAFQLFSSTRWWQSSGPNAMVHFQFPLCLYSKGPATLPN
jgi:hypothetical protein